MNNPLFSKIISKKEFSDLPRADVESAMKRFEGENYIDEERVKLTRDLLRKVFSVFTSQKLLSPGIIDKKNVDEVLKKHLSTKERFEFYGEIYSRLLKSFEKDLTIFDLGAGINGLSYEKMKKVIDGNLNYVAVESVGQLVKLMNYYFKTRGIESAGAIQKSLFDLEGIKKILKSVDGKKIVFLFKVLDSLEMMERNYSKKILEEIVPLVDKVVISFATRSLVSRKKFVVNRSWILDFVGEKFKITDDFEIGAERYVVFEKQ